MISNGINSPLRMRHMARKKTLQTKGSSTTCQKSLCMNCINKAFNKVLHKFEPSQDSPSIFVSKKFIKIISYNFYFKSLKLFANILQFPKFCPRLQQFVGEAILVCQLNRETFVAAACEAPA